MIPVEMRGTIRVVAAALDEAGFVYEVIPHAPGRPHVLRMQVLDESGTFTVLFFVREDEELARCTAHFPGRVPAERRREVGEAMARVNLTLSSGAFTLDLDDGSAQFWTVAIVEQGESAPSVAMLMTCWNAAARFNKVLETLLLEGESAERAVAKHW